MLVTPLVSDKSYKLAGNNTYVFIVPLNANKAEIISVIEAENEGAKVKDIRMMVSKGKVKAVNRGKRSRPGEASRKNIKKAYVRLAEGKIEIAAFEDIDNQVKANEEKAAKAEVKQQAKDAKADKAAKVTKRRTGRRGDK